MVWVVVLFKTHLQSARVRLLRIRPMTIPRLFASSLCTYNYRANKTGTAASTMSITYNPANGAVVVDAIN
ncbi:hypothetical protein [sulfur-oxidizing endosymbiont of Gigantopelta aegis]|uniref:hypothetical protein n=1 Tax=sulfur-oxidizing endosymbiont of Gigantopelta aegis TaxID=2794934 RepID=UPI001BE4B18A|nr:hypothetical protein [sulfur-oxidizing endosymbiont of Gigantopelta aegis]